LAALYWATARNAPRATACGDTIDASGFNNKITNAGDSNVVQQG
jgi:hypothetical protein